MKIRLTLAILLVALLPSDALGAVGLATGAIPFQPEVDYLEKKNASPSSFAGCSTSLKASGW